MIHTSGISVPDRQLFSLCKVRQLETQFLRGSEQTILDRPLRRFEDLAYGSQLQALEMLQFKDHALAWGQRLQSAQNVCSQFSAQQLLLGIVGWSVVRDSVQQVVLIALDVQIYRAIFSTASISPQMIQAEVGDNAVDPGREGALEPKVT